jgi:hypothetical protein
VTIVDARADGPDGVRWPFPERVTPIGSMNMALSRCRTTDRRAPRATAVGRGHTPPGARLTTSALRPCEPTRNAHRLLVGSHLSAFHRRDSRTRADDLAHRQG